MRIDCLYLNKVDSRLSTAPLCYDEATVFIKPQKTGRLCPLCEVHLHEFQHAVRYLQTRDPDRIEEYELITLENGEKEYVLQPPRERFDRTGLPEAFPLLPEPESELCRSDIVPVVSAVFNERGRIMIISSDPFVGAETEHRSRVIRGTDRVWRQIGESFVHIVAGESVDN